MEGSDKSAGGNNGIPPPRLTYTHIPEETENNALYPSTGLPLKPPPPNSPITSNNNNTNGNNNRRDESVPPNGVMYWMRIEDYATQVRIVALQARCGNVLHSDVQKALDLAIKIQEELRPLLHAAQYSNNTNPNNNNPNFNQQAFRYSPSNGNANRIKIQSPSSTPEKTFYSPGPSKPINYNNNNSPSVDGVNPSFSYLPQNFVDSNSVLKPNKRQKRKRQQDEVERSCKTCSTTETPEWRRGPLGPRTLCNACGLKWAKKLRQEKGQSSGELSDDLDNNQTNNNNGNSPNSPKKNTFINETNNLVRANNSNSDGNDINNNTTIPIPIPVPNQISASIPQSQNPNSNPLLNLNSQNISNLSEIHMAISNIQNFSPSITQNNTQNNSNILQNNLICNNDNFSNQKLNEEISSSIKNEIENDNDNDDDMEENEIDETQNNLDTNPPLHDVEEKQTINTEQEIDMINADNELIDNPKDIGNDLNVLENVDGEFQE